MIQNSDLAFLRSKIVSPKDILGHLRRVRLGYSSGDKLKILAATFLQFLLPFVPKRAILGLNEIFNSLCSRTVVSVDWVKYFLVDIENLWILSNDFENFIPNYLKPKRKEVFLDVGAYKGKYTLTMARSVGDEGLVVAVEPNRARVLGRILELANDNMIIQRLYCRLYVIINRTLG